jgi:hypothetical protein
VFYNCSAILDSGTGNTTTPNTFRYGLYKPNKLTMGDIGLSNGLSMTRGK